MGNSFYFPNHPSGFPGGGPEPWVYSVEDQNRDAAYADAVIKSHVQATQDAFKQAGIWYPVRVVPNLAENGNGVLVNGVA